MDVNLQKSPLGKESAYPSSYSPDLLFPIARKANRQALGISGDLPFFGADVWNGYELSWLNPKGKPVVAMATFVFSCETPYLIESKSFKLYLSSLHQTQFASFGEVSETITRDLSARAGAPVQVGISPIDEGPLELRRYSGISLDELDVACTEYVVEPAYLQVSGSVVEESFYTHLLKSNCPVTGQPDWASMQITYVGKQISRPGLLQYLVSFRNHSEFHEQCVERVFVDILTRCQPVKLSVEARYTRRGGLDINPFRSTEKTWKPVNIRLSRQ